MNGPYAHFLLSMNSFFKLRLGALIPRSVCLSVCRSVGRSVCLSVLQKIQKITKLYKTIELGVLDRHTLLTYKDCQGSFGSMPGLP